MKKKLLSLVLIPALLTGCSNAIKLEFAPFSEYVAEQDLMRDLDNDFFYSKKDVSPITVHGGGTVSSISDLLENNRLGKKRENIISKGDRKLLVVPIYFNDSDPSSLDDKTIFIQNAFFGRSDRTTYDSVAGYYNKSSYGQLKLTGEVAPWFNINISSSQWKTLSTSKSNASSIIVAEAVDYIKANNLMDLSIYDTDGDDEIDGVYAIYDHPFDNEDSDSLFWAYTYYTYKDENNRNHDAPYVNDYSWTSVNTIIQKDNKSYTNYLIHETGHLLGLSDYYNTDYTGGSNFHYQPTGCFDMMDYNIGDHSAFSKYLLNWTSPLVLKSASSFTYKLKPLQSSGEYILIPSGSYNDSPFSEYLLVEYFTPQGLNKFNGTYSYIDSNGGVGVYRYPQHYGVKIYHVNASLGYFKKGIGKTPLICLVNDPEAETKIDGQNVIVDYAYDNSLDDTKAKQGYPVLYHLLESSGNNTFIDGTPASNATLFEVGDDFGISVFKDFTFNDGSVPGYTLKIKAMSSSEVTLEITKK